MTLPTKAVILARGLGTRMRAETPGEALSEDQEKLASAGIKTLVPIVDGKTLLDFIFESLSAAGFIEICLVIGDEHQAIRDFCAGKPYDISFAIQKQPLGTADAVLAAESFCSGELFLSVNSDNLYPVESLRRLRERNAPGLIAFDKAALVAKSNIPAERIAKFADISLDAEGYLSKIVEKPDNPAPDRFVSMNAWVFSPKIFEACRSIGKSERGEYELADAVMFSVRNLAERYVAVKSDEGVLDLSSRADVKTVGALIRATSFRLSLPHGRD